MESLIYTATPEKDYTTLIILIISLILLSVFIFLVETKKISKITGAYRQIAVLLGGLLAFILFITTVFSLWNMHTIQPVKLYDTYLETYHGKTEYSNIKRAGIFNDKEQSIVNAQMTIREDNILVIERRDQSVMLFAEDNYDIQKLVKKIREQMRKNKNPK